jgi:V-type H+-transporting ATPase subunit F
VTTGPDPQKNFLVVDGKTDNATIESTFDKLIERKDIGIILINQHASYICLARDGDLYV